MHHLTLPILDQFKRQVLPSLEGNWLRDSMALEFLDSELPPAIQDDDSIRCGPAAFGVFFGQEAAATLTDSEQVWMNRNMMERALKNSGVEFLRLDSRLPMRGLCLIQWQGPWLENSYRGSDLAYTHWISVAHGFIFDHNWNGWLPLHIWEEVVLHELLFQQPSANGWEPLTSYELQ